MQSTLPHPDFMNAIETTFTSFDVDHMRDSIMAVVAPTPSGPKDENLIS